MLTLDREKKVDRHANYFQDALQSLSSHFQVILRHRQCDGGSWMYNLDQVDSFDEFVVQLNK